MTERDTKILAALESKIAEINRDWDWRKKDVNMSYFLGYSKCIADFKEIIKEGE